MGMDQREAVQECLRQTLLFQGLPEEELGAIANLGMLRTYRKGETVFHRGDEGTGFFVLKSGRVKVFNLSAEGKEQILHIFSEGDHFAEVPALDGKSYPASAAAIEACEIVFLPRRAFLELLEQQPLLAINMLKSFARHLRRFSHLVDNLSLREVPARLATYLLSVSEGAADPDVVQLELTKGQLAAMLGTIPETLSRVFYRLSCEEVIRVEGAMVQILDREYLRNLQAGMPRAS